jgi:hypothetical protein
MSAIWPLKLPSTQKFVLITLADQANDAGVCWPGVESVTERTGLSERAVRNSLRWLEANGYITTLGRPGRTSTYHIEAASDPGTSCPPAPDAPRQEMPGRGARDAGEGGTSCRGGGHQMPPNHKEPKRTIKEPDVLPDWVPREDWDAFVEMRKAIGHPLTGEGKKRAVKELSKLREQGNDPAAVLNASILNSWRGLFPLKANAVRGTPPAADPFAGAL